MQSFLQYYQLGRQVKAQWERDLAKAEALYRQDEKERQDPSTSPSLTDPPLHRPVSAHPSLQRPLSAQTARLPPSRPLSRANTVSRPLSRATTMSRPVSRQTTIRIDEGLTEDRFEENQRRIRDIGESPDDQVLESPPGREDMAELGLVGSRLDRSFTADSVESFGVRLGTVLTCIDVRHIERVKTRRSTASGQKHPDQPASQTVFVVGFDGPGDPMNPQNWSTPRRMMITGLIALLGMAVGFATSVDSFVVDPARAEFGVTEIVETLATGLFLIGFGLGALYAGPISETVGRNPIYLGTMLIYLLFIMASGLSRNIHAQLACRFFAGFFASTPLTCAGGTMSDMWTPVQRVYAFPIFANAAFMGPVIGPLVGGFIADATPTISWRWSEWITLIASGAVLIAMFLLLPETYAPIILKYKAQHLRALTGDTRFVSESEIRSESLARRILLSLYRPFVLLVQEPIIIVFALYLTVVYVILFTFLVGYPYIYNQTYGLSMGMTGLCFLGIAIGLCLATALVPFIGASTKKAFRELEAENARYAADVEAQTGLPLDKGQRVRLPPEQRLWYAMIGAPAVPISMFWMGWTTNPSISYWSPLVGSLLFGFGILCIFISSYQYLIDAYELYAASALAAVSVIRYCVSGVMCEVGLPFYGNLGVSWALTIMGIISAVMVPLPYILYFFGPKIRSWSKYTA